MGWAGLAFRKYEQSIVPTLNSCEVAMGFLSDLGNWAAKIIPASIRVVKKAAEVVYKAASAVDALLEGKTLFQEDDKEDASTRTRNRTTSTERPDFMGSGGDQSRGGDVSILQKSIDESKKKINDLKCVNENEHMRIKLQIDVMELIVSASTIERFSNNINIHAANLQIHLQNIQNIAGVLDDVNRQRTAVKALMGTLNHIINVMNIGDKVDRIEGLDVSRREGRISVYNAYKAYENTKQLLLNEIDSFSGAIRAQLDRVEDVRVATRRIGNANQMIAVSSWLENSVEPKLNEAMKEAEILKGDLVVIPRLEATLRRELEAEPRDGDTN